MKVIAFAVVMYFAGCAVGLGCVPREPTTIIQSIENAAAVAQYKGLLDDCRARGKAAKSYAVYEACADAVDAELCRARGSQCGGVK